MTKYEDHVVQLCDKHDIKIRFNRSDNSVNMLTKTIWINRELRTVKTYFGALHEIGHVLNEHPLIYFNINRVLWNQSRSKNCIFVSKYRMQTEIDAWKQAYTISKWRNFAADKLTVGCLSTYLYGYNMSHKKPFKGIDNEFMGVVLKDHRNNKPVIHSIKTTLFS